MIIISNNNNNNYYYYNDNNNNNNNRQFYLKKTIKILFTINSLKKKEKTIHSKTLFTISVDLKST